MSKPVSIPSTVTMWSGALVKEASALLGGKGGGRPSTAQGGGKDGAKLDEALARIEALVKEQVKA